MRRLTQIVNLKEPTSGPCSAELAQHSDSSRGSDDSRSVQACSAFVGRRIVELRTLKERVLEEYDVCRKQLDVF